LSVNENRAQKNDKQIRRQIFYVNGRKLFHFFLFLSLICKFLSGKLLKIFTFQHLVCRKDFKSKTPSAIFL